ncbi:MAG: hypothetical protein HS108_01210 [Planctomycetes bacterium]|jgi:hypothetical protein|nr:hypothetical protein [Planctomycetota bacterium]MCL4730790.1 hypothetical protein [Planctomycetota bacterium]
MKRRCWLPLLCALAFWPAVLADAQGRIVIRPAIERPPQPATPGDTANPDAVKPVEPTPEEAERIAELIEQLGAPRLAQRDRAMAELAGFEARALRQVREAKNHADDEIANRCALLEEVIQSRQAELFLAARRLSLQPNELERMLAAPDVKPLLEILRARAQPGLTPLWARVLAMLAARPQVSQAAQLCAELEGVEGYGLALAEAARFAALGPDHARGLAALASLLPPSRAPEAVDALAFCGVRAGGADGVQEALRAAWVLRGQYAATDVLAALRPPDDPRRRLEGDGEGLRQAVVLCMTPAATDPELRAAQLPALGAMSPLVLAEYLGLLRRSGLVSRIENVLVTLVASGASARVLGAAGAAWADAVDVARMQAEFSALPGPARLGALDALWLNPREPERMHPFLLGLLRGPDSALREPAARMLGQYRAPSTVRALADTALAGGPVAVTALESLAPMADLLVSAAPEQLKRLVALLPQADLALRAVLIDVLVATAWPDAASALRAQWLEHLPRNEMLAACRLFSTDPSHPAGALAAAVNRAVERSGGAARDRASGAVDYQILVLMRVLLAAPADRGFELLVRVCADETSGVRSFAAGALALAGKDGPYIADWIRRVVGETPDAQGMALAYGVALSTSDAAEDFRRRTLQQGASARHLSLVHESVLAGRSRTVTREDLLRVLFDTPANARNWLFSDILDGPLPPDVRRTVATTLLFSEDIQPLDGIAPALVLADSGVDVLQLLFGDDADARPRDAQRTMVTALMGNPQRARELVARADVGADGANFAALQFARAYLGMVDAAVARRLLRHGGGQGVPRLLLLKQAAQGGDATSARMLLDRLAAGSGRFAEGGTAGVEIRVQRWRGPQVEFDGVAGEALRGVAGGQQVSADRLQSLFGQPLPPQWSGWWACRRALLEYDPAIGKYRIKELP